MFGCAGDPDSDTIDNGDPNCVHECALTDTVAATCTDEGYDVYTCVKCGYSYKDNYTAPLSENLTHSYEFVFKMYPHVTNPYVLAYYECSVCGDTYAKDYVYVDVYDGYNLVFGYGMLPGTTGKYYFSFDELEDFKTYIVKYENTGTGTVFEKLILSGCNGVYAADYNDKTFSSAA
ncbi:MAG: hypothetical protein LUE27_06065 [Clostridia bacterium]|nr:hypothetical protein [Clostridia bacterium]